MDNRADIIRKINSLRDMANHASTEPKLVEVAMRKYQALMDKYNLTLTDLDIKEDGISVSGIKKEKGGNTKSTRHPMGFVVLAIAELTDTKLIATNGFNAWHFVGIPSDVQYATWIYDLIRNGMETGSIAYKMTASYHRVLNETKINPAEAIHQYKLGFAFACVDTLKKMIAEAKQAGNSLVVLKKDLIESFLKDQGKKAAGEMGGKGIALKDETQFLRETGYKEGEKVKLRNEVKDNNIAGYLN